MKDWYITLFLGLILVLIGSIGAVQKEKSLGVCKASLSQKSNLESLTFCKTIENTSEEENFLYEKNISSNHNDFKIANEVRFKLYTNGHVFGFDERDILELTSNITSSFSRCDNYQKKLCTAKKIHKMGFDARTILNYMFLGLEQKILKLIEKLNRQPIEARVEFWNNKPHILSEEKGYEVRVDELYELMFETFLNSNQIDIDIPMEEALPTITADDLRKCISLRGSFVTKITGNNQQGRIHNIKTALAKFEGKRIEPEKSVSFNNVIGSTDEENGYKLAKIIVNGKFVDGYGGGVCQASTTLYNALLLSDVEISEVHPHSLRVGYVAPSFDAMVSYGSSDLVFRNNTGGPIYISTYANERECGAFIYGEPKNYTIRRRSENIDRDEKTPENVSLKSKGFLEYYQNSDLIRTKRIRNDTYFLPKTKQSA